LGALVIDCHVDDLDAAAQFWATALGGEVRVPEGDAARYRDITTPEGEVTLIVQKVDHESRVHLDIEADDKDAEVERLKAAGAKEIARIRSWIVLEAPTGHRFCVVGPQRPGLAEKGNAWD
jgi:hypothetical protein